MYEFDLFTAANQSEFWKMVQGLIKSASPFVLLGVALILAGKIIALVIKTLKKAFGESDRSFKSATAGANRQEREQRQEREARNKN